MFKIDSKYPLEVLPTGLVCQLLSSRKSLLFIFLVIVPWLILFAVPFKPGNPFLLNLITIFLIWYFAIISQKTAGRPIHEFLFELCDTLVQLWSEASVKSSNIFPSK